MRTERRVRSRVANWGLILVDACDLIPSNGGVIEGVASIDQSAITGKSAPVTRESGDRSAVTGGTRVLSD